MAEHAFLNFFAFGDECCHYIYCCFNSRFVTKPRFHLQWYVEQPIPFLYKILQKIFELMSCVFVCMHRFTYLEHICYTYFVINFFSCNIVSYWLWNVRKMRKQIWNYQSMIFPKCASTVHQTLLQGHIALRLVNFTLPSHVNSTFMLGYPLWFTYSSPNREDLAIWKEDCVVVILHLILSVY